MKVDPLKLKKELAVKASLARMYAYLDDRNAQPMDNESCLAECVQEEEIPIGDVIQLDELESATQKLDDNKADVQDLLLEVNLGDEGKHKPTFVSQLLEPDF